MERRLVNPRIGMLEGRTWSVGKGEIMQQNTVFAHVHAETQQLGGAEFHAQLGAADGDAGGRVRPVAVHAQLGDSVASPVGVAGVGAFEC